MLGLLSGCGDGYGTWPKVNFEKNKWLEAKYSERFVFAKDLIDGKRLIGKNKADVYTMLGKPSSEDPSNNRIVYTLKEGKTEIYFLDIRFDNGKPLQRVNEAFVASD